MNLQEFKEDSKKAKMFVFDTRSQNDSSVMDTIKMRACYTGIATYTQTHTIVLKGDGVELRFSNVTSVLKEADDYSGVYYIVCRKYIDFPEYDLVPYKVSYCK